VLAGGVLAGGVLAGGVLPVSELELSPPSLPDFDEPEEPALDPRSFLAQPDPLKWIVGATNALRTGPSWHTGQVLGPWACTPWTTSNRWLQL
jgi:hypothetical protein